MIVLKESENTDGFIKTDFKTLELDKETIVKDYRLAFQSRQASLIGRREVMGGKAKFGIFGGGKEVAQVALAKAFRKGDFRSGYYRDQTMMFALGMSTIQQFFAQLYAHADIEAEPATGGRSMNAHFGTRSLNADGSWKSLAHMYNSSTDVSPTGSQMPRLVGLAYASRLYREIEELHAFTKFSRKGNEIAFGMIGNATCAEGMFWEAINAIGVLRAPALISIWDDGFGISVANEHQVTKADISALLQGFQREPGERSGYDIYAARGWNYPELVQTYQQAARIVRSEHVPAIIHVREMTQPQGHSTSGSHERYKSRERLKWENEFDCIRKMRKWMIEKEILTDKELSQYEEEDVQLVKTIRDRAWEAYQSPIRQELKEVVDLIGEMAQSSERPEELKQISRQAKRLLNPLRRDIMPIMRKALMAGRKDDSPARQRLVSLKESHEQSNSERYDSDLHCGTDKSALKVQEVKPVFSASSHTVNGFEVLNACFDAALARDPRIIAFGEDVGKLGDVNQGFKNLQAKYGALRVSDTGIRECTIIGQAIGLAMRGLRPIAEVQYLDYLLYALQIMSDDLATLHWRSKGGQKAPVIVRTRGHRLEGIWHSGSPMAGIISLVRGMHVVVPRNMTQAAGFYNTLLQADDPALLIEVLNSYRIKERVPDNIGEFTVPLGVPEVLREGTDLTVVTYGACCRIVLEAARVLSEVGIEAEVIDVQTLLPFDLPGIILESLKKTSRILFVDEDVPGGATAYMLQQVIEKQGGYTWLDSGPRSISSKPHRPAYGSDGDYFSKPNVEDVFEAAYELLHEANPAKFPLYYR